MFNIIKMEDLVNSLSNSLKNKGRIGDRFKEKLSDIVFESIANLFSKEELDKIPADKRNEILTYSFLKALPANEKKIFESFIVDNLSDSFTKAATERNYQLLQQLEKELQNFRNNLYNLYINSYEPQPERNNRTPPPIQIVRTIPPGDEELNPLPEE
jgi:hypothetical protein